MPGVTTAYQTGNHASRPANGAGCILYSCTTHGLVYRDDGSSWATFLTLPSGAAAHAASHEDGGSDEIDVTGLVGAGGGGGGSVLNYPADIAPASPDAQDEEFEGAFNVTPTFLANSGTPTNGAITDVLFDADSGPTTNPRYNVDSDVPSHLLMQPLSGGKLLAYWPFAPASGTDWAVLAKLLLMQPAVSAGEHTVHIGVSAATPTLSNPQVANSIAAELRTNGQGYTHASLTPGARQAEWTSPHGVMYAGIVGRGDNSITIFTSVNGLDWRRRHRIASGTSPAGALVTNLYVYVFENGASVPADVGMVDFIRYSDSSNDLFALMGS